MFGDEGAENDLPQQAKRRTKYRWSFLLLLLIGVVAVGVVPLLIWQLVAHQAPFVSRSGSAGTTVSTVTSSKTGPGDPPIYWQTIEQQIAQGLHLTVAQVKALLQPPPGQRDSPGIAHVAAEQGISPTQLRIIEINAIQKGHDLLVRMGLLTKQGSDQGMQTIRNWDQATLDDHVTRWFLNN